MFATVALLVLTTPPALADRDRFPPREVARQAMQFNRAYRSHLLHQQAMQLHRWEEWQEAITETDYLFHCWDWLHAVQGGEGRDEAYWLRSLERLKELIGEEAYAAGQMPPNVPLHRFYKIPNNTWP